MPYWLLLLLLLLLLLPPFTPLLTLRCKPALSAACSRHPGAGGGRTQSGKGVVGV